MIDQYDEIRTRVLTDNTAQGVLNHLKALESNRAHVRARWIWELLQNARDASANSGIGLVASIEQNDGEIIFRHNGSNFKMEEIAHLIYHGSTKVENEETIGQYGSGFLTTHLLSAAIGVSGQLDNGKCFDFHLKREVGSVSGLSKSMEQAWDDFKASLIPPNTGDFTTTFRYPLGPHALEAVEEGIEILKLCAPLVVAFNQEFSNIEINSPGETNSFKVVERIQLEQDRLQQVTVAEIRSGNQTDRKYLLAQGDKATVAIPLESMNDDSVCLSVGDIPRLFLGFPLVGTEKFSFPAVINSLSFTPTGNRDGVYLGQSTNDANRENQAIIEEACKLLIRLIQFTASNSWRNVHLLAEAPTIQEQDWLNPEWLRKCIREHLVSRVRQIPVVLNEFGEEIHPDRLELPLAETAESVEALWKLLDGWDGKHEALPRKNEVVGWWHAIKSWAMVLGCDASSFDETVDGCKLASFVHNSSRAPSVKPVTHRINRLNLREGVDAIKWLDKLIGFLEDNGLHAVLREKRVVPSQEGFLRTLPNLRIDREIHEELKIVAHLLDWRIRCELRDTKITSLNDEVGAGAWNSEYVVGELIRRLQEQADENPDDNFQKASVHLFDWIVAQEKWGLLRGFPVFADRDDSGREPPVYLPGHTQDSESPLAPIRAWPEDLRPFSDLFPSNRVLADAFFEAVPGSDTWQILEEQSLVRTNILITDNVPFSKFFPDHPLPEDAVHRTSVNVTATDIVGRAEIVARVRDSQSRARLFWSFLTEWLAKEDLQGLEVKTAECECGETHRYYPATWIESLRETNWVRLENNRRDRATAHSLANLLRDGEWKPGSLTENPAAVKLLEAIGVTRFDLLRAFGAANDEQRKVQDDALTEILVATDGNVSRLNHVREFVQDLENDNGLLDHLADRRDQRRRVHENQNLGEQVESLVKKSLEGKGFTVKRTGTGSDFKIEYNLAEMDDVVRLKLGRAGRSWLVEVKATRDRDVRMTTMQARTAANQGHRFLLCVVPVELEHNKLELDDVQANMRFVENIGPRVARLCDDLDNLDDFRNSITGGGPAGIQLEVVSGTARVRVASAVWQDDGFPLADLPGRLI